MFLRSLRLPRCCPQRVRLLPRGLGFDRGAAGLPSPLTVQQLLSLPAETPTGVQKQVLGMWVTFSYSDLVLGTVAVSEFWSYRGLYNGRPYWRRFGLPDEADSWSIYWNGGAWLVATDGFGTFAANEDVPSPEGISSGTWETDGGGIEKPVLTLNPLLELLPPDEAVVGISLYSGSAWWLMLRNGSQNGRPFYYRLGTVPDPDDIEDLGWYSFSVTPYWALSDVETGLLYSSEDDVATPDLATSWIVGVGVEPAPTIEPITRDDVNSGFVISGSSSVPEILDAYYNTGEIELGHFRYRGVNTAPDLFDRSRDGVPWDFDADYFRGVVPTPFPWGQEYQESAASGSITVSKSRPAGLRNWALAA